VLQTLGFRGVVGEVGRASGRSRGRARGLSSEEDLEPPREPQNKQSMNTKLLKLLPTLNSKDIDDLVKMRCKLAGVLTKVAPSSLNPSNP
jgi:hypothetical protein